MELSKLLTKKFSFIFDKEKTLWIDCIGIASFSVLLALIFSS